MISQKWRDQALDELRNFGKLTRPTDEWTPRQPSDAASSQARVILNKIDESRMPPPYLMATIDGGIDLEWTRNEREMDVIVSSGGAIEYIKVVEKAPIEEGPLSFSELDNLCDWLLGR
ncbi:MAG TPA: hypothetical protein VJX23_03820 [Candidatus Binataceae bacterium]|nr:hypothetical protein [Candidatus Binataceae bacterium]